MTADADALPSREMLEFQLFEWLDVGDRVDRETLLAVLDTARRLACGSFLPHHRQSDLEEPLLEGGAVRILPAIREALRLYSELGFFGLSFPEALGGFGLPFAASLAIYANFAGANVATAAYPMLTTANARLIAKFGSPQQIAHFAKPQIEGRWFGTMCLSEPQAGSSLGDIVTAARPDGDDAFGARYLLSGSKMWISGGDQDASENIVHLVLAKILRADGRLPEGSKGISLFIVPKFLPDGRRNDVAVTGLNHKLGYRGTSNCLLSFGDQEGATGWRIGDEGQGLSQMFMMMNEARISVGMGAAALASRGYRRSVRYAGERTQGRAIGVKSGMPIPIATHPDVRRMLLQQKVYAEGALALCLYCATLVDRAGEESDALLALLTPVAKTWPSEYGLVANDLAIQVHGGYGYTRDFDVELLWRDNRLNPIHEGTTGIQGIDLLGRKLLSSDGTAFAVLMARIAATAACAGERTGYDGLAVALTRFWARLDQILADLSAMPIPNAFEESTLFLRAFGHGVVAWLWLDQATHARELPSRQMRESVTVACRFFFETELPQAVTWLEIIGKHSDLLSTLPDGTFS